MRRDFLFVIPCAIAVAVAGGEANAQDEQPLVFEAPYFDSFAPQTALDMVRRVPGFTVAEGEERRGFASSAGNVLIDGAAPAAKSEDIEDILERIPASEVVRLELIRGSGASASNAQSVRVNVVRRPSSGQGSWRAGLTHADDGRVTPEGQLSWSGRRGALEYNVSGVVELSHTPIDGAVRAYGAAGVLDETEFERIIEDEEEFRLSGDLSHPFAGGALSISGVLSREDGRERQATRVFEAGGAFDESEDIDAREVEDIAELTITHRRNAGPWQIELGALATRRWTEETEEAIERDEVVAFDGAEREDRDVESGETIARLSAARDVSERLAWNVSGEIAFNTLEQRLSLTEDDGSGPVIIPAPGANVRIEELRGEVSTSLSWRPAPNWTVEVSTAVEVSTLEQSGDSSLSTDLAYWKPSLQIARAIGDNRLRLRLYRDVGQLDFEDFAASAELENSSIFAGNPDLRPETSWRVEAAGDWRLSDAALELTAYYWAIEDALDFVPVGLPGDQFDARGNIGDATLFGLRATFEAPVPLLANASLRGEATWQESEANDPVTGEARAQSEIVESRLALEFRHDVQALNLAWGVEFERERLAPEFRLDRITDERDIDDVEVWIESTAIDGVKLRLFAQAFSGARAERDRVVYSPDRAGSFDGEDNRVRDYGPLFGFELQGSF